MQVFRVTENNACILTEVMVLQLLVCYLCVTENDEPFICLCILAINSV